MGRRRIGWPVPANVAKLYLAIVALITLVCIVALVFGTPMFHIIRISGLALPLHS